MSWRVADKVSLRKRFFYLPQNSIHDLQLGHFRFRVSAFGFAGPSAAAADAQECIWNNRGAWLATREIFTRLEALYPHLQFNLPPQVDFFHVNSEMGWDLSVMMQLQPYMQSINPSPLIPVPQLGTLIPEPSYGRNATRTRHPDHALPSAIIFHDSFFIGLQPFSKEQFRNGIYIRSLDINWALIEKEKPDVVIHQVAERYLRKLPDQAH